MALFEPHRSPRDEDLLTGSSGSSQALSVAAVETQFVADVYAKLSNVYDVVFGPALHPGRLRALAQMRIQPGDRVLEVGVGTGINLGLYPQTCHVTGIDLSPAMLDKARERVSRKGLRNVRLFEMDASDLQFADESFDIVYAPYLISVVPDPVQVVREMQRVCRTRGRIVVLNHFRSPHALVSRIERVISPLTVHIGFKSDLDLPGLLAQAALEPDSIERVNFPKIWSLVTCVKREGSKQ
jgi:phosphatidylethanolamine/phosphatidyl-N-methylethanolamine N-methyltransferase